MYSFQPKAESFGGVVGTDIVDVRLTPDLKEFSPGDCVGVRLETLDTSGNALILRDATSFSWSGLRTSDAFFSDAICTKPANSSDLKMQAGKSEKMVYLRANTLGGFNLQVVFASTLKKSTALNVKTLPRKLVLQVPSGTMNLQAGFCSGPYTLQMVDNFGTPVPMTQYDIQVGGRSNAIFLDTTGPCAGQPLSSNTVRISNDSKVNFYLRSDSVSSANESLSFSSADSRTIGDSRNIFFESTPYKIVITGGPPSNNLDLGLCEPVPFNVELRDSANNLVRTKTNLSVSLNITNGGQGSFQNSCGGPAVGQLDFIPSENSKPIYLFPRSRGLFVFQGSSSGLLSGARTVSIDTVPVAVSLSGPSTIIAGSIGQFTVKLLDGLGAELSVHPGDIPVNITGSLSAVSSVCSDAACNNSVTQVKILANQSTATVFVRPQANLESQLQILMAVPVDPALGFAQQDVSVLRRVPAKVRITGGPASGNVKLAECDGTAFNLELLDANNNSVSVPTGQSYVINLDTQTGSGQFFPSCGAAAISSITFASNQTIRNFSFKAMSRGTVVLRASTPAGTSGTLSLSVITLSTAVTLTGPGSIGAAAIGGPYTITLVDALGNALAAPASGKVVNVSGTLQSLSDICSTSTCSAMATAYTIASGASSTSFYVRPGANLENRTETLAATPSDLTIASDQISVSISRRVPAKLKIAGGPASGAVDLAVCDATPFTVELLDSTNTDVTVPTGQTITVTLGMASGSGFFYTSCGGSAITTLPFSPGQQTKNVYFKALSRNSVALSATAPGLTSATMTVAVTTLPVGVSITGPASVVAGAISGAYQVGLLDALGALVAAPAGGKAINILGTLPPLSDICTTPTCASESTQYMIAAGSSSTSFYVRANASSESQSLTLIATPVDASLSSAQMSVSISRRVPARLKISGGPANGKVNLAVCEPTAFTLELQDASGAPVTVPSGQTFSISLLMQSGIGTYYPTCGSAAITSFVFTAGQQNKTFTFKAMSSGTVTLLASGLGTATFPLTVVSDPKGIDLSGPTAIVAGVPSAVYRVSTVDALGVDVVTPSAVTVTLSTELASRGSFCSASSCIPSSIISQVTIPAGANGANFYFLSDANADMTGHVNVTTGSFPSPYPAITVTIDRKSLQPDTTATVHSTSFSPLIGGDVLGGVVNGTKMAAVGYQTFSGAKRVAVAQYNWDASDPAAMGTPDTLFSADGEVDYVFGDESWASAVAVKGGKLLIAGVMKNTAANGADTDIILFQLTASGAIDTSFHGGVTQLTLPGDQFATSLAVASDGYIYVGGYGAPDAPTAENTSDFIVASFDASGNNTGVFKTDFNASVDVATSIAISSVSGEERVLIAGSQTVGNASDFAFARLLGRGNAAGALGAPDASFQSGKVVVDMGGPSGDVLRAMTILSTGQIVAGGYRLTGVNSEAVMVGLRSDGVLDSSFGSGGKTALTVTGAKPKIRSMISNPATDEIYLSGSVDAGWLLLKVAANGLGTPTQNIYGVAADTANKVLLEPNTNKPIVLGQSGGNFKEMRFLR